MIKNVREPDPTCTLCTAPLPPGTAVPDGIGGLKCADSEACAERIGKTTQGQVDMVNHPPHYTSHPSGVECITVTEHMGFNLGNAVKYIWRADLKNDAIADLEKAAWYVNREIARRKAMPDLEGLL